MYYYEPFLQTPSTITNENNKYIIRSWCCCILCICLLITFTINFINNDNSSSQ